MDLKEECFEASWERVMLTQDGRYKKTGSRRVKCGFSWLPEQPICYKIHEVVQWRSIRMWLSASCDWPAEILALWPIWPPECPVGPIWEGGGVKWALVFIKTTTCGNSELLLEILHGQRFNSTTVKVYIGCIQVLVHKDVFPCTESDLPWPIKHYLQVWHLLSQTKMFLCRAASLPISII